MLFELKFLMLYKILIDLKTFATMAIESSRGVFSVSAGEGNERIRLSLFSDEL